MSTTKARDDQPFDFNLNSVKVEKTLRPFRFVFGPNNERWEMAHRETLDKIPLLEAYEQGGEAAGTLLSLRTAMGEDQWERFRKLGLRGEQLTKLTQAYDKFCGTDEGESEGSTDS